MKILAAMLLVSPLWACTTPGPFERAGRNVDESVEGVRDVAKDVIEDVSEGAKDVRDDVQRGRGK